MMICIVSSKHVSYNPRVVKEADAFAADGHVVTVVTVCNNSDQAILDEGLMVSRSWRLKTVNYRKLGVTERFRWLRVSLRQKLFMKLLSPMTQCFGIAEHAQGREFSELRRLACSLKADLYIAHHAETLGAAFAAAKKHCARFAFDAEDFHSEMFNAPFVLTPADTLGEEVSLLLTAVEKAPKCSEQQRIEYLERKYLPFCDYITAASDGIAEAYAIKYDLPRPTTVLNTFPLEQHKVLDQGLEGGGQESPVTPPHLSPVTNNNSKLPSLPKLYWYSQVIGPGRGLEDAVKALSLLTLPCELHIRGTAQPAFVGELTALAVQLGVQERLFIHPPCPPDDLITEAAHYDIGLALENGVELNRLICVTNKVFTYMIAGLAIVATDTPGQRGIMAQAPDAGVLCRMNDVESLAAAINRLIVSPDNLQSARGASRKVAEEQFNWENESQKVIRLAKNRDK